MQVLLSWNVGTSIQWCILFAYNECVITHFAQSELSHFMWCFIAFFLLERNELTGTQNSHQMTAVITTVKEYFSQVCEQKWFRELQKLNCMCCCARNVSIHNATQVHSCYCQGCISLNSSSTASFPFQITCHSRTKV